MVVDVVRGQQLLQRDEIIGDKDGDHANIVLSSRRVQRGAESSRAQWEWMVASQAQSTKILVNKSSSVAAPLVRATGSLALRALQSSFRRAPCMSMRIPCYDVVGPERAWSLHLAGR